MSSAETRISETRLIRPKFVHLRTHSAYSLLEGALPVKTLTQTALASSMPALAVTDRNNLFGALEFAETAAGLGVQPIIGATLNIRDGETAGDLVFLVKNKTGYTNLMALISAAHLESEGKQGPGVAFRRYCSVRRRFDLSDGRP